MTNWWSSLASEHVSKPLQPSSSHVFSEQESEIDFQDTARLAVESISNSQPNADQILITTSAPILEPQNRLYLLTAPEIIDISEIISLLKSGDGHFVYRVDLQKLSFIIEGLDEETKNLILRSNQSFWKVAVSNEALDAGTYSSFSPDSVRLLTRAPNIEISICHPFTKRESEVSLQFDKQGDLTFTLLREVKPKVNVYTDKFTIQNGKLLLKGHFVVHNGFSIKSQVMLLARTSSYLVRIHTTTVINKESLKNFRDHLRYDFSVVYDFERDFEDIQDDAVDLYLDILLLGKTEEVRKRIGISRYLVRRKTRASSITKGSRTLNIVPYYTYIAKNPSIQFEHFDRDAFELLQKAMRGTVKRLKSQKPIWLVGEVSYKAQDNGLWLFKYLQENCPNIDSYYVMDKDSREFHNVKGYNEKVIQFRSKEHIRMLLSAARVIGTHQPLQMYPSRDPRLRSKVKAKHIFLQHGVTAAKWIEPVNGRRSNDFTADLIVVNSEKEKSFFVEDCGYDPKQVAITGFARFDGLFDGSNCPGTNPKQLLVIPTWRPWLQDLSSFQESDYFIRWKGILQNQRFRNYLNQKNIKLTFCLHPNMQQYSSLFKNSGATVVFQGEIEVQKLIKQSSVLLTDYSSVAFDATFIEKPVIFYQFDSDRFPEPHADPITELPGPVLVNEFDVVEEIIDLFEKDAVLNAEYRRRAALFLFAKDQQNRKRIVHAIENLPIVKKPVAERFGNTELGGAVNHLLQPSLKNRKYFIFLYRILRILTPIDPKLIVFETNLARSFSDSPRAIFDELVSRDDNRKLVIVCNRRLRGLPNNVEQVKRHSLKFIWSLARAKYWINNHNFPDYIRRRKKGIYIQTWHGTPLKRMFMDQDNFYGRDSGYIERVKQMTRQWNKLISPSPYFTKALSSSYDYKGDVLELGHARNDILLSPEQSQIRNSERFKLNIPDNKFVILYAPTFRDDQPTSPGRFAFKWPFSPEEFVKVFGKDVVLLVRKHNLINSRIDIPEELAANIIDVSRHDNVNKLFLATDMLVTDYSSLFFDYSLLNKPILFFAYDLQHYMHELRGFYLDYSTELPGPILTNTNDLFKAIDFCRSTTLPNDTWIPQNFIERFSPHDDGEVSARVIDALL